MTRFLIALLGAFAIAASPAAAGRGPLGAIGSLPPGWSHAQINVVYNRQPHTVTYDRGRVLAVTPSAITLRERDGVVVTVPVSSATQVTVLGRPALLTQLRRRMQVLAVSVDGAPAALVRVQAL